MKIGLYVGATEPTKGGEYTFIVELLAALERRAGQCSHELVLCHYGCDAVASRFPRLTAIDLKRRKQRTLYWRERLFDGYPEALQQAFRRILRLTSKPRWDERVYLEEGIQFILHLLPSEPVPRYDIPYATIVWDLAHRNCPYFPEVGAYATWRWRQAKDTLLVGRASLVYTSTKRGQRELEHYFQVPPEHIKVLMYPAPSFTVGTVTPAAQVDALTDLDVPREYIFYPAQFWAHKNHVVVLEACKLVRDESGWDLGLVFTGSDKGNRDYVRAYARRLGLDGTCKFLDFVEHDELIELYRGAFCLTYASFLGPDNLPPLEAFALGCPVVAAAVPGSEEQLGGAALLFAPHDERELAQHILALRDPETRAALIAKGHKRVQDLPTWDDYADGLVKGLNEFASIRRLWP